MNIVKCLQTEHESKLRRYVHNLMVLHRQYQTKEQMCHITNFFSLANRTDKMNAPLLPFIASCWGQEWSTLRTEQEGKGGSKSECQSSSAGLSTPDTQSTLSDAQAFYHRLSVSQLFYYCLFFLFYLNCLERDDIQLSTEITDRATTANAHPADSYQTALYKWAEGWWIRLLMWSGKPLVSHPQSNYMAGYTYTRRLLQRLIKMDGNGRW